VFAEYAVALLNQPDSSIVWFAIGAVVVLTTLNMLGVHAGRHTQKALVIVKMLGLLLLIVGGLSSQPGPSQTVAHGSPNWALAVILTLYAYGGWNDAAFVTAEVRHRSRNIPRALMLGIGLIIVVYLLVNLAYLRALGFEGLRNSERPAADALVAALGEHAGRAMSFLVMVSALGGLNGLIMAVSRVHATVGADHPIFERLGRWSKRTKSPVWSLFIQGLITVLMIMAVGTDSSRKFVDSVFQQFQLPPIPWDRYFNSGFETLFAASAPIFWLFFLCTGVAYFVLHVKDRDRPRPFVAPWFPICPLILCGMSAFGLYSAANYGKPLLPLIAVPLALGFPLYGFSQWLKVRKSNAV
jgi:amino acid transporter